MKKSLSNTLSAQDLAHVHNSYDIVGDIAVIRMTNAQKDQSRIVAKAKNLKCGFLCAEFPCQLHYGKEGIYTTESFNNWKELNRNGFSFGGQ